MANEKDMIAYQGVPGAYSHQACVEAYPEMEALACNTFEGAIAAVTSGTAQLAMLPVENSTVGRVADIHNLLPESGLYIIGEHFVRVHINLLGTSGAKISDITHATSHTVLLGQCRNFLQKYDIQPIIGGDTAGSAKQIAEDAVVSQAALASPLAGEIFGLDVLASHIEDNQKNTTRFLVTSPIPQQADSSAGQLITTFVFQVRNIPAALYKAMGGFATNSVNMVKLESYMIGGSFTATQFYADVVGHPDDENLRLALEELAYFTTHLKILGTYPAEKKR